MSNMIYHTALKTAFLFALLLATLNSTAHAAPTIWNGPPVTFTKVGGADPTLPENQDRITDNVWITRGNTGGIYNAAVESAYDMGVHSAPSGTRWALGTTDDINTLSFGTWHQIVGPNGVLSQAHPELGLSYNGPLYVNSPAYTGIDLVMHLEVDDIYLDIRFLPRWGQSQGEGGTFTYVRSTPTAIPEPSTLALVAGAFVAVLGWRRWAG